MRQDANRTPLGELIDSLRRDVSTVSEPARVVELVARRLTGVLGIPDLLTAAQMASGPGYRQHVLHVEPEGRFSIVALVWLPGQATPIHDHIAWCATGVHRGQETEVRYRPDSGGLLVPAGRRVNTVGTITAMAPPGDIHRVSNESEEIAISVHVYGADITALGSSIRRCYDAAGVTDNGSAAAVVT